MADKNPVAGSAESSDGKAPAELTSEQFDHFMQHGEFKATETPEKASTEEPAEKGAEAAAAKPVKQAGSTEPKKEAVPETADSTVKPKKGPGQKKTAGERATEIEREAEAEERRLEAALERRRRAREAADAIDREERPAKSAEKGAEAAAAAKGKDVPPWKKYAEMPDAPKAPSIDDPKFKGIDDYMVALNEHTVAMGHFIADKVATERAASTFDERSAKQAEATERDQELMSRMHASAALMDAELAADPEILDRIPKRWKDLSPSERLSPGEQATPAHFVKDQVIFNSDHPLQVSEALCRDDFKELKRIAQLRPERIIREIAILDATFATPDPDDTSDEAPEVPAHPRKSQAPAPGKALGKKAAAGVDPLKKAIAENDFDAFNALESARERAEAR